MTNIIQGLWIGNNLSNNELLCLNSYVKEGHTFHLYAYEDIPNIPEGISLLDANQIIQRKYIFHDNAGSIASFADWFRIKLLYEKGNWWVDMDTICLKKFDFSDKYCISSERDYSLNFNVLNNGFLKFPKGDIFLEKLLVKIEKKIKESDVVIWGELGVYLFREIFEQENELKKYVVDPEVFCPIDYFDISSLICKTEVEIGQETYAIHLWNEIWRRGYLSKDGIYHPESLYEKLKEKYL
ncbi:MULTISPECIES: hypothetical protein [Sphingobacterium]|uniref:hypothetical protein n=1 Tax=Sphingobacterium TaxID=28453 RepID=UPI00257F227D|nr:MULTISPECIES: hypothetical protein [Sphingobacterium]